MSAPAHRLVLVSRRFWPMVGGAEQAMLNLAAGLKSRGWPVTLLTARWDQQWPTRIELRGVPVERLPQARRRAWGTLQYMTALSRWLRRHRREYDLVYVSMLKHDAFAALGAVRRGAPVVLRAEGAGPTGDVQWQQSARLGWLIRARCRCAAAVVAPSQRIAEELRAARFPAERIRGLPNGVPIPPPRSRQRQADARSALESAQTSLGLPPGAPLVVYTGRLHPAKGLEDLLAAWLLVGARCPEARLWIAGEGPHRAALAEQVHRLRLGPRVVLAGAFLQVDELLAAADLFVLPSYEEGMSLALLEAMAAGLPVVASDIPGNRALIESGGHGLLVPPRRPQQLADSIVYLLGEPTLAGHLGASARARVEAEFSLRQTLDQHEALFRELLCNR